jgi:hypothetical protein
MFTIVAIHQLQEAGYRVTPADGVPGLWNIEGLANDVTTGQLCALSEQHGKPWSPVLNAYPMIRSDLMS